MPKSLRVVALVLLIPLLAALWAINVRNPISRKRALLEESLAQVATAQTGLGVTPNLDYAGLQYKIADRPALWQPLTGTPAAVAAAPDLARMLTGVTVTRNVAGTADSLRIQLRLPGQSRGEWVRVGDSVNGLVIKAITDNAVVFSLTHEGKEYEYGLPRP